MDKSVHPLECQYLTPSSLKSADCKEVNALRFAGFRILLPLMPRLQAVLVDVSMAICKFGMLFLAFSYVRAIINDETVQVFKSSCCCSGVPKQAMVRAVSVVR